ncbi:uncharacterized protein LOC129793064 [Lutzomyia longipalpis]|uniref:uncharacterized protein LOC129793064 n=1 Tax=Lutzomyia longipalpis TaxID=7200 RepID=UPI0024834A1B|nr:uncharacterized protein LOC129793064 [Lutzomyia longipalpis]
MACGGLRCSMLFIGLFALIQAIAFLVMGIFGILAHQCDVQMDTSQLNYLIYLTYFRHAQCGEVNWQLLGIDLPPGVQVIKPDVSDVALRMQIFIKIYIVTSCLLIITSIMFIAGTSSSCLSRAFLRFFCYAFAVTFLVNFVFDLVATGFHIYDITWTTTLYNFLEFIQVENRDQLMQYLGDVSIVALPIPSVIMTVVSSRGVLIAIMNFTGIIIVFMSIKKLEEKVVQKPPKAVRAPDFGYERQFPPSEMTQRRVADHITQPYPEEYQQEVPQQKIVAPVQTRSRYDDINPHPYQYDNHTYQPENQLVSAMKPHPIITTERRFLEPLKGGESDGSLSSRASPSRSHDSLENNRDSTYMGYARIPPVDTKRTPKVEEPNPIVLRHTKPTHGGSLNRDEKPAVRKTYSDANRFSQQAPPEELRSQLPWSYFQSRHEVKRPRKIQEHSSDEIPPPVPVPDYTLHFPKKGRPGPPPPPKPTKESIERWSGPEVTY